MKKKFQKKIRKVKSFGKEYVEVILEGDSFDDAKVACSDFANENDAVIIPPFENEKIIGFAVVWDVKGEIQLNNIGIHPDYRRCGAATGLFDFILEIFVV